MENFLWKFILKLNRTVLGRKVVQLFYNCGLVYIYNFFAYEYDRKNPTDEMKEADKYFKENAARIQYVCTQLEDEESVETYRKAIRYRGSHSHKDRPKYNRKNQYFPDFVMKYVLENNMVVNFCDCGAYNGDSVKLFLKTMKKGGGIRKNCCI